MKKLPFEFDNHMSRTQLILGLIYLPLHVFVLPLALAMLFPAMDAGTMNLVYFGISAVVLLAVFHSTLRRDFDELADRLGWCAISILMALGIDYVLSYAVSLLSMLLPVLAEDSPNDQVIMTMAGENSGAIKATAIFLAPIVEELLFRGVIFGGVKKQNRILAYVLSILMFALLHVWQYALIGGDWTVLLYMIQYIPVSFALAWCYERSGTLWCPIAFHMMINAMSFKAMELLESLA